MYTNAGIYSSDTWIFTGTANYNNIAPTTITDILSKINATWTTNSASKTYGDADPNPLRTGSGTGFVATDNVTATYTRVAGETVLGGPYHITATLSPAGVLVNYNITNTGASFTVYPKSATWTTNPISKTYGDADLNPLTTGSGSGFLAADNVTATYSRAAGETVAGGPYHITATLSSTAALSNYEITNAGANFTINAKSATWTTNPNSKSYGDNDPNPLTTGNGSGFLAGDNVTATYSRPAGETVTGGPYHITATLSPSGVLSNYNVTNAGADFTINAKNATWTTQPNSKTYGDDDPVPLTSGSGTGFVAADNVTATYSRDPGQTVAGSPYHITATLSPAGVLNNYNITNTGANFTIDKKTASVTPNAASKTYGDVDPALTGTLTGFLAADGVTATYSRAAGETVAGNPYTISATLSPGGVLGNYQITYNTAEFTIDKKTASVTPNAASKTYGDADATLTGTLSGFLAADGVTATYSRAPGETVAGSPYTISATLSPAGVLGNYQITYNTANFTIDKKAASVTPNAASKTYGDTDPTLTGTLSGFLAADGVTATYSRTTGETVAGSPYTISATLSPAGVLGNYQITYNTAEFTIDRKALDITDNNQSKNYGDTFSFTGSEFTVGTGQLKNSDSVTSVTLTSAGAAATATVSGSPYDITPSAAIGTGLGNYSITYHVGHFTVNAKALDITANDQSKTYGATFTFTGSEFTTNSGQLVNGDTVTTVMLASAGAAPTASVSGSPYDITPSAAVGTGVGNYAITYHVGHLSIYPKGLDITANNRTKTYGDTVTFAGTEFTTGAGQLVNGNTVTSVTLTSTGSAATATVAGSPHAILASAAVGTGLGNYTISYHNAPIGLPVNKANATVTVTAYNVTYNGQPHTATYTITGVNGETGATVGTVILNTTHTNAGTYVSDSWSFTGAANYNDISATTITDRIAKANATAVITPYNVAYDYQSHMATITSITGVNGEMGVTVGTVDVSGTTHTLPGDYASDPWSLTATANYNNTNGTWNH